MKNEDGNLAVAFALVALPVFAGVALAVDYSRAVNVRSFVQSQADIAALSAARFGPDADPRAHLDYLRFATEQRYGASEWIDDLRIEANWLSDVDFTVKVEGVVPAPLGAAVPGFPEDVAIGVRSTVRTAEPREVYTAPEVIELDNEAGDYNRIYVYCFDPAKIKGKGKAEGNRKKARSEMTPIADNAGTKYKVEMPRCEEGQTLSYKLLNVRLARLEPKKWDDPKAQRFEFYTDTTIKNGSYDYYLDDKEVLETVLCDDVKECRPKSKGGIIPEGKNRKPMRSDETCSPGKYIYYGWEDRPPGLPGPAKDWTDIAWTDKDYDDIRVVIGCPTLETRLETRVRLIR